MRSTDHDCGELLVSPAACNSCFYTVKSTVARVNKGSLNKDVAPGRAQRRIALCGKAQIRRLRPRFEIQDARAGLTHAIDHVDDLISDF